jgi:ABC-type branched-subunit amino acid transport system substrate-binding protein
LVHREKRDVLRRTTIGGVFDRHYNACCQRRQRICQKKYDAGATDTEIKIGNITSTAASAYGTTGKTEAAYFREINCEGGINGRKINFISYDDGYSPLKAVERARRLVESEEVFLIFGSLGTPSNTTTQEYVNAKKVPQLFVQTGATKWNDPQNFPCTIG